MIGFNETRAHCTAGLDPGVLGRGQPDPDSNLGRLRITTTPNGGSAGRMRWAVQRTVFIRRTVILDLDHRCRPVIRDDLEQRTKALGNVQFNAS
jgi:hypothetical protein